MNLTSYRFSIAWPRVLPNGSGTPNSKGLDYYGRLVDALLDAGIRPFPTLYHWDLPQSMEDAGGWPNRDTAGRFVDYAQAVVRSLGDRVENWMIFNEPAIFTLMGYRIGIHAPGRRDADAFFRATHTVNLAQGDAFRAIKAERPNARVGTAFSMSACEPAGDTEADAEATERWHRFTNCWYLEPALLGRYPDIFPAGAEEIERKMGVRRDDAERMRAPLDFLGINLYTRSQIAHCEGGPLGLDAQHVSVGAENVPRTDFGWEVWPQAIYDVLVRVTRDYDHPVLEITENGCSYDDGPDSRGVVNDRRRIDFFRGYLTAVARAIDDGADVRGYHAWTLLDNFEWSEGYAQRFGLTYVDFPAADRTRKESGRWYGSVAAENGFDT
jgi:beta-glucosidase